MNSSRGRLASRGRTRLVTLENEIQADCTCEVGGPPPPPAVTGCAMSGSYAMQMVATAAGSGMLSSGPSTAGSRWWPYVSGSEFGPFSDWASLVTVHLRFPGYDGAEEKHGINDGRVDPRGYEGRSAIGGCACR